MFKNIVIDGKTLLGALILGGYYIMIFRMMGRDIPPDNLALIRDQMLVLGPAIGVVVGSLFRTSAADERQTQVLGSAINKLPESPPPAGAFAPGTAAEIISEGIDQSSIGTETPGLEMERRPDGRAGWRAPDPQPNPVPVPAEPLSPPRAPETEIMS